MKACADEDDDLYCSALEEQADDDEHAQEALGASLSAAALGEGAEHCAETVRQKSGSKKYDKTQLILVFAGFESTADGGHRVEESQEQVRGLWRVGPLVR